MMASFDIVIPTIGRASLGTMLEALGKASGPRPRAIYVIDDRRHRDAPLPIPSALAWPWPEVPIHVRVSGGRGPAAARNVGARAATSEWIAFLDDDVVPDPDWLERLCEDLTSLPSDVAGSQGAVRVRPPIARRPTDAERNVLALEVAFCISADLAVRRHLLAAFGGFDERFRRAYREDTELALRTEAAGYRIVRGSRRSIHLLRDGDFWISVRAQAGNADDVMLARIHGRDWRRRAREPRGRFREHVLTTSALGLAGAGYALGARRLAQLAAGVYALSTLRFFAHRIAEGPGTAPELVSMAVTSALIPPAAVFHHLRGRARAWRERDRAPVPWRVGTPLRGKLRAIFFDRDGTLIHDVLANRDPARVRPMEGARKALDRVRAAGLRTAIVTNQGPLGEGRPTPEDVDRIHARVAELLGPFDGIYTCLHAADRGCDCRKPKPGLLLQAMRELGVDASECAFIGDIGADIDAARAAGMRAILVPNAVTREAEIHAAPEVASDLESAVERLLERSR